MTEAKGEERLAAGDETDLRHARHHDHRVVGRACGRRRAARRVGAAAVPTPPANSAVITVKGGGDRSGTTGVTSLALVVLPLRATTTARSAARIRPYLFATCTSDAGGDCSFIVPDTQFNGANRDKRFWVVQQAAPGLFANLSLGTGGTGSPLSANTYRFWIGPELRAGTTVSQTDQTFMVTTGNSNRQASGGVWQNSRTNPVVPKQCGADVGLLIDVSGSVSRRRRT